MQPAVRTGRYGGDGVLCAWLMHNVKIANLVLIVLSIIVIIFFFARPSGWIKPGAIKCLSPLS
jgi:hypothetical protein